MSLTDFALRRNRLTLVLLLVILAGGITSYRSLPRSEDPDFTIRTALITTFFPGASPERVEQLVTDKIEQKVQELPELDYVSSISRTGVSLIYVNIKEKYKNMRPIWRKLRDKVEDAGTSLPQGLDGPFVHDDFGDVFGIMIALTGDGFSQGEMNNYAKDLRKDLLLLKDVARVDIMGNQEERIFVEFSNARLAKLGLGPARIVDVLREQNIVLSGGYVNIGPDKIVVEPSGNYRSLEDLRRTVLRLSETATQPSRLIYLADIAEIHRGYIDPPDTIVRYRGRPAILLAVNMTKDGNIVQLGERIDRFLKKARSQTPVGIDFDYAAFQPEFVTRAINNFMLSLLEGVAAVVVVMILFLGLRTGLVVGTLIPMTMLMTFLLMKFFGIPLQQVSIAALIIALGMLVDNAIVMSERIMVRIEEGENKFDAAVKSGRELAVPLLTGTLTTCAAFLCIYLAQSTVGEYCESLFEVITIVLLSSWLLSLTMIPLFCFFFLKAKKKKKPQDFQGFIYRNYRRFLLWLLTHRLRTLLALAILMVVVFNLFRLVPQIFFPPSDRAQFVIDFWLPEGSNLRETNRAARRVEKFLSDREEIRDFSLYVGESSPRFYLGLDQEQSNENYAFFLINCRTVAGMNVLMRETYLFIQDNCPRVKPVVKKLETGAPVGAPVQIRVEGRDISSQGLKTIQQLADQVRRVLREIPGTVSIRDSWGVPSKKLLVKVDQSRARRAGLSSQDIAVSLQTQLAGYPASEYREKDEIIPIVIRSVQANRSDLGKIEGMNVYSIATGKSVPLLQIARTELVYQVSKIERRNRKRTLTVKCDLSPGYTATRVLDAVRPRIASLVADWPPGYEVEYGGEFEESAKASASMLATLPISAFLILILLIWQFNSFRKTLIILLVVPMGMIGAILALLVTGSSFGFMTMLGMVSLAGIVINDAIELLERIKHETEAGRAPQDALVYSAQSRFRPILLTSITTLCGLAPLGLQGGPLWESMAWAISGGLLFSTVLTLGIVPVLYSLLFKLKFKKNQEYGEIFTK